MSLSVFKIKMTNKFYFYGIKQKYNKNKNVSYKKVETKMLINYQQSKITSKKLMKFNLEDRLDNGYDMISRSEAYEKITLKDNLTNKSQDFYKDIRDIGKGEIDILTKKFQKVGIVKPWIDADIPDDFKSTDNIICWEGEELWEYIITTPELSRLDKLVFREFKYIPHYNILQETGEIIYNNHK